MTNPFLLSEIEKPQQPKQAEVNPYSMQAIETDQRQDLRNTLIDAVRQQPEHVAEAARLAKRYPAPIDALASNLQDVKLQEAVDKYDETLKTSPKLQQYILDKPWETARLHKDIPQLSLLEQTFNVARSVPAGAVRGLGSVASGAGTLYDIAARQLAKPIIAIGGDAARDFLNTPIPQLLDPSATLLKQPGQSLKTIADVIGVDPANRNFATDVGEGIGQLIQQIGVQIATGGTASLVTLFSQGADAMATKTAKDAASQDAKDAAVLTGASITALTEKYGVDKLLNRVPPKIKNDALRWVADKLAAGGIEATQEIVEGVLQDVVRVALTNADAEIGDGALYEGGVAATSAAIVRAALGVRVRSNEQIERYDRAVEASNNLRQQLQAVQDIQARAHSPEVFREVVQGMADQTEGAPKSLWVDGEVLAQLPAEELATLPAEVQEQIADAAASSGFVEIPIGDIMLAEQGSVLEQTYVEYARETPDSPTLAEAQEAKALMESTLMQDAEGAIAQAQEQDAVRASSEVVRKAVLEQLNTAGKTARQYRPSVNDALARVTAALFTTQAQRMNMTPEQAFQMSGFAVRGAGQQQGKGKVLNAQTPVQAVDIDALPEETIADIAYTLNETIPAFDSYTEEQIRSELLGLADPVVLERRTLDPATIDATGRSVDQVAVDNYAARTTQAPPVVVDGNRLIEGGHRLAAALQRGDTSIEVVDIGPLLRTDWDNWLSGGEVQPGDPVRSNTERQEQLEQGKGKPETSNVKLPKKQTATPAVDIRKGGRLTGDQAMDIHQVAAYFDKIAGGPSDFNDPKAQAKALKAIVAELKYQLSLEKSGLDWYEEDIKTSFELTQQVIPELADPRQRMLFSVVAGLQSPGTNARDNWAIAAEAFQHYKATGTIPGRNPKTGGLWQGGPVSANKEKALDFLNIMVQDLGESATIDWLMGQHTVKELNDARKQWGNMGPGVTGKATDTAMGVVAFGPKVGPFVMNINGIHEITVDVWATRSFNRYFGTMLGPDGRITDAPTEPQRRVAKELFNAAAEKVGIKAYQVQSVLWFFEQQLFNHLGTGTPSYGFSDGARKFAGANGVDTGAVEGLPVSERDAQTAAGDVNAGRFEQAGDRAGRDPSRAIAPLAGAPSVPGFSGPDPRLVAVAEQYARDNGIDLKRQAEYVQVDPERAARIAAAYEAMQHSPQDPAVREAYENLIQQTRAQYDALVAAGYKFWFVDLSREDNQQYASSPWNAMRDIRANQQMGVFPTNDGFGSQEDFSPEANPLLADTGLQWPTGGPDGPLQPVLANDLFRAVHDAFGHGLEGAGFRAQGEENAWQAHARLFTGSAVGAITTETRGQNSWLNFGPFGEQNRTAQVEDTVFADQKTGLMPEWTWSEGRAADMAEEGVFNQFAGERAQTADRYALATAQQRLDGGENAETVRKETGWFKGADGKWRFEIDDANAKFVDAPKLKAWLLGEKPGRKGLNAADARELKKLKPQTETLNDELFDIPVEERKSAEFAALLAEYNKIDRRVKQLEGRSEGKFDRLGDVLDHPALYAAYPEIANYTVILRVDPTRKSRADGFFNQDQQHIHLETQDFESMLDSLLHEVQHGIQSVEGFASGGSVRTDDASLPAEVVSQIRQLNEAADAAGLKAEFAEARRLRGESDKLRAAAGFEQYQKLAGEVESRNVERRRKMTADERRAAPPSATADVADSDVIVVFNGKEMQSAPAPANATPLLQGPRGTFNPRNFEIVLNENANLSTYFHELSHFYLDFLGRMAEMPNASPEVVEDFNSFLNWTGVSQEQWREWRDFVIANPNKPLPKGMVKVHEALARAGEQYFLEGKAPSVELQPFMRRFARWMESVYTSLVNFIAGNPDKGLQLNADIRRFFDRALATDEQIAQAEQAAGMTPDDDATAEAKERLNKRSMAGFKWSVQMRDKIIADLRKQAKEIEDSIRQRVTEEVDEMPAMQARAALDQLMAASPEYKAELKAWNEARAAELARATEAVKEQLVAAEVARTNAPLEGLAKGRFLSQNRAEVENKADAAVLTWEKSNPKPRRITHDMTPQMESIADKYGYSSVDQMLQDIDAVGSRREMIDGLTEQRMLEEHGDLIDDRAIQQAANEAVHNDARARALAAELRTQQEMLGERTDTGRVNTKGRRITVNTLLAAARNFADNVVGRAKVMDLGNLSWKHNAAEARAGKRWQQLTAQGKTVEAVKAKQDQVVHNAAAKAALEAQAEIQKLLTYLKKFDKDTVRTKLPASYLDQIDKLLERVDLRVSTTRRDIDKRAALSKWIESQHALGLDPVVPDYLLDDAQLTSYKEMTVDQFRELTDTIKNIEHFGRLKSRLLAAKDKREFDAIATEIANEIIANKGTPLEVQLEPDGRIKKFFKGAWADHRKLNSLVRQMDGGKDNGPFYRALVRSMNEAGTKENVMLEQATEALAKIYAPIEALPGGFSGASVYIPEINASLSRAGRLAVALNWGNSINRQRVMGGDNWTEAQVEAILATLSTTELEFVNNVWAQLDSYWPEMKAKQERVNGVVEDKVEAEPFELTAADGTVVQMRGGYYPIKYDSDRSLKSQKNEAQEVAADMLRGAILRPSTRRGHLKAREEEVNRPVRKDLSVITQHVNQVVHDLAWHEWLIDATRLLNDPRIAGAIRDYHGPEIHRAMTEAMRAIAEGDIAHQTEIDKLLLLMRANVTRSIMGASLTTALLQPFGLTQSMARIGVVPVLKGAWRWAGDGAQMENSMKWISEKSDFMRLRSKTFNRELREISQRVQGKSKFMQVADASLFFLMQKLQMVADVPTWIGAYEKALAGGVDEATAVQLADEAVLSSQGGGNTKDLAGVQRNLPFLTQFYSYFSTTLNLVAEKTALTDFKNPRAVAGWVGDMALLAVIPAILPALITYLLKGGGEDDEPEDWAKRLAEWQASYLLGMFVGLRELPAVWSPFDYQGPPAGKLINDGKRLVQQAGQGEIDDEAVLATIGFLGTALGIPTIQMTRSYKGWLAWDEGDAPVTSILFGPPPKD